MTESHTQRRDIKGAIEHSYVVLRLRSAAGAMSGTLQWFTEATRQSFLYRWLTKEPDPEVIVIDLRDTYSLGPVITLIDWLATASSPTGPTIDQAWQNSQLYRMGDWVARWIEVGLETRTAEAIQDRLEPPDPPEEAQ